MTITLVGSSRELKYKHFLPPIDLLDILDSTDGSVASVAPGATAALLIHERPPQPKPSHTCEKCPLNIKARHRFSGRELLFLLGSLRLESRSIRGRTFLQLNIFAEIHVVATIIERIVPRFYSDVCYNVYQYEIRLSFWLMVLITTVKLSTRAVPFDKSKFYHTVREEQRKTKLSPSTRSPLRLSTSEKVPVTIVVMSPRQVEDQHTRAMDLPRTCVPSLRFYVDNIIELKEMSLRRR